VSAERAILRVFTFRPLGSASAFDETARTTILPDLAIAPGILDAFVGRRAEERDVRTLVSVWASTATVVEERSTIERLHPDERPALASAELTVAGVHVAVRPERFEPPRVLRVFRGDVREGELEAYLEQARAGTLEDAATNPGLVALYLGVVDESSFVTASAWTSWTAIERATGGDVRRPMATKNSAHLAGAAVAHYEVLPNGGRPGPRSAGSATG
jgi:hypothetical protein